MQGRWIDFVIDGPFSTKSHYDIMIYPTERHTKVRPNKKQNNQVTHVAGKSGAQTMHGGYRVQSPISSIHLI